MWETFTALLVAHVLADFVFQCRWMVKNKRGSGMAAHGAVVLVLTLSAAGTVHSWVPWALAGVHIVIDLVKAFLPRKWRAHPLAFLADQIAHLISIFCAAVLAPALWDGSLWPGLVGALGWSSSALSAFFALLAGYILATRAGGFFVRDALGSLYLKPKFHLEAAAPGEAPNDQGTETPASPEAGEGRRGEEPNETLEGAGAFIGHAERSIVFLFLVLSNRPDAIAFILTAKSLLRFGSTAERMEAEYVVVGTLVSFAWAVAISYGVMALLDRLGVAVPLFGA